MVIAAVWNPRNVLSMHQYFRWLPLYFLWVINCPPETDLSNTFGRGPRVRQLGRFHLIGFFERLVSAFFPGERFYDCNDTQVAIKTPIPADFSAYTRSVEYFYCRLSTHAKTWWWGIRCLRTAGKLYNL